jgi:hypothetical protein
MFVCKYKWAEVQFFALVIFRSVFMSVRVGSSKVPLA